MRGKRAKQYRKLMHQYGLHFGFREPYQVLLDAEVLKDASRYKMDFISMLEKTLHGQIKPMITQCSMRHLYNAEAKDESLIMHAKGFERRRCNHHELEKPLSTLECFQSVIDPKGSRTNKHRYVVVSQDDDVRAYLRSIPGVPMVYLKRSVMIMEPMAGSTEKVLHQGEKDKFRSGLKGARNPGRGTKRGREDDEPVVDEAARNNKGDSGRAADGDEEIAPVAKKKKRGPSGPNPLSVQKKKKKPTMQTSASSSQVKAGTDGADASQPRKRRHRHKPGNAEEASVGSGNPDP